jgi:hypothetical protein
MADKHAQSPQNTYPAGRILVVGASATEQAQPSKRRLTGMAHGREPQSKFQILPKNGA